jgi:hypothetical protein
LDCIDTANSNYLHCEVQACLFRAPQTSIDRKERKQGLLDVHNKDVAHFEGAVKESGTDLELFKSNLKWALDGDYETRAHFQDTFFYWLVKTAGINFRKSFRKVFLLSWQENGQFSQNQQGTGTAQAGEDQKVDTNLVYLIENQEAGAYITINLQRNAQKRNRSELQVLASATKFLHKIYESWFEINSTNRPVNLTGSVPSYIRHYGITFVGENDWAIFEAVPNVDSQGRWLSCTPLQIDHGGYDKYEDYLRLIRRINQIHSWGLTEFAEELLKSGAIVDDSES